MIIFIQLQYIKGGVPSLNKFPQYIVDYRENFAKSSLNYGNFSGHRNLTVFPETFVIPHYFLTTAVRTQESRILNVFFFWINSCSNRKWGPCWLSTSGDGLSWHRTGVYQKGFSRPLTLNCLLGIQADHSMSIGNRGDNWSNRGWNHSV